MESIEETTKKTGTSFINHMFSFDNDAKVELMNMMQYAVLAILPIVVLNKTIQTFIPPADEDKNSLEIAVEVLAQIVLIFGGMFFIDRLITYVPTYSGEEYRAINFVTMIIGFMVIVLSLQTKIGEKVEILYQRVLDAWYGESMEEVVEDKGRKQGGIVSRPEIQQRDVMQGNNTPMPPTQYVHGGGSDRMMSAGPHFGNNVGMSMHGNMGAQQPQSFDQMYQEPMAANDGFGAFGSAF